MRVNLRPAFGPPRSVGCWWVNPEQRDEFDGLGLRTAADVLAMPGVVVSGHVGRNVSRVELGGRTAYLKREHRVRLRDRFRSLRDGFGWASISAREAAVLLHLEAHGLPGPTCLAYGEAGGEAFVLVAAAEGTDLRTTGPVADDLTERLGRTLARLHAAGVDQPDLFAKHVLVRGTDLTILDWQRAVLRSRVPWPNRVHSLAALRATTPDEVVGPEHWDRIVGAYVSEAVRCGLPDPAPGRLGQRIQQAAQTLLARKGIRSQRTAVASVTQELVRIDGETVCAIPAVARLVGTDLMTADLYDPARDGAAVLLPGGRSAVLRVRCTRSPLGRWWAALRGRVWRSPELKFARLLFHLERHGIPAPKLLAYGQTTPRLGPAGSFVLFEPESAVLVQAADAPVTRGLLDRLHAAGCRLVHLGPEGEPFGASGGRAVIQDVTRVRLCGRLTPGQVRRDRERLAAYFRGLQ